MKERVYGIFDSLPNDALLTIKDICKLFACSEPTIWRNIKNGKLPEPIKPTLGLRRWRVGDIRKILNQTKTQKGVDK